MIQEFKSKGGLETQILLGMITVEQGDSIAGMEMIRNAAEREYSIAEIFLYGPNEKTGQPTDTLKLRLIASRVPLRKEFDEETGLYYYGARYYDPRLSLWLSIDPKEEKYSNVSTYCYVISNPLKYTDPTGMEIDMTKVRLADEQLKLSTTQSVIKDLASQTGLQLSLDKDNKLQYAKNDERKPIVNKITNKKGKEIDAGSKTARNFLIKMIDNKTEIEVSYHAKRTVTSGTQIGLSFEQISNMVKGAVGVDGNTLGFGMTFLHELHHTTIGGDYHDSTELFGTGPVVDNMNIIRNELNKQGFNYGERLNYKAIHTKEGNIIPFNESALTSLKYNSSMGKKAHYIKTK